MPTRTYYVNNAVTTLAADINSAVTSLTVDDGARLPTGGNFFVRINTETMLVTAVAGTTFTVTRAVEGTVAASHTAGDIVKALTCAGELEAYAAENYIYDSQDTPKFTITDPTTGLLLTASDFTWVNQGTSTAVDRQGKILLTVPFGSGGFRGLVTSAPTPPYSIVMAWSHFGIRGGFTTVSPYPQSELIFRESGTGKMFSIAFIPRRILGTNTQDRLLVRTVNSPTDFVLSSLFWQPWQFGQGPIWCKIEDDNTDLKFYVGPNGQDWILVATQGRTAHMAGGPDQVGFGCNPFSENTTNVMQEVLHFGAV